jgi:hypothetical protein
MVPQLCDQDLITGSSVYNPVFRSDAPGPEACEGMFKRLRFSNPCVWRPNDLFYQKINSRDNRGIGLLPVQVIVPSLRSKDEVHASGF